MSLRDYQRKRDFRVTAEPRGTVAGGGERLSFVVQKHAASHLHYDFRLELDGVLKSWAVPKGPSLDPTVKRLAVEVEDHPVEYGSFEGTIPAGEYGGGTVMLWDRGGWTPDGDPRKGLERGRIRFTLDGERLRGAWSLVRSRRGDGKPQWLLIKSADEHAAPDRDGGDEDARSITTGRSMEEIAAGARPKRAARRKAAPAPEPAGDAIPGAKRAALPDAPAPQLATLADAVPDGEGWLHEVKFDGYRLLATVRDGRATLVTRGGKDWTHRFATVAKALGGLAARDAVLDGEVVALAPDGTSSFQLLQNALRDRTEGGLVFYAFDLLHLDGSDLRGVALHRRKELLRGVMEGADGATLRFSDHVRGSGAGFHREACRMGLEGIMCKEADAPYRGGRSKSWLKVKCGRRQEFVIGGFTDPRGSRKGFGSLLLGVYEGDELRYVGKVGTGFDAAGLRAMHARLRRIETDASPFANHGVRKRPAGVHWVKPELVCEIAFTEWTDDDILRHPSFQGLREDKQPTDVIRESAAPAPKPAAESPGRRLAPPPSTLRRAKSAPGTAEVDGTRISHPGRVLFPDAGITKLELAEYFHAVAPWMLPHAGGRPLTLVRCPDGVGGECFYQKHVRDSFPAPVGRVDIAEESGEIRTYPYVDSAAGLVALVQMGVLELHSWGARIDRPERPDRFVIDLDPAPDVEWVRVVAAAREVRDRLAELGLRSFLKTTGGKGLHVVVPVDRRHGWDEVKDFTRALAADLAARHPGEYITKSTLAKRGGRIYIDYLRNGRGATAVAPFSVRNRPSAAVSLPIAWEELAPRLKPASFTPAAVLRRLARLGADPWAEITTIRQSITKGMRTEIGMR